MAPTNTTSTATYVAVTLRIFSGPNELFYATTAANAIVKTEVTIRLVALPGTSTMTTTGRRKAVSPDKASEDPMHRAAVAAC